MMTAQGNQRQAIIMQKLATGLIGHSRPQRFKAFKKAVGVLEMTSVLTDYFNCDPLEFAFWNVIKNARN